MNKFVQKDVPPLERDMILAMGNWLKIADTIYSPRATPKLLKSMIKHELNNKRRSHIVDKLMSRYSSLQTKQEKQEVQEGLEKAKKTPRGT